MVEGIYLVMGTSSGTVASSTDTGPSRCTCAMDGRVRTPLRPSRRCLMNLVHAQGEDGRTVIQHHRRPLVVVVVVVVVVVLAVDNNDSSFQV